jgi:hypothetical protein
MAGLPVRFRQPQHTVFLCLEVLLMKLKVLMAGLVGLAALVGMGAAASPARASQYSGYYTPKYRGPGYSYRKYWYWSKTYGGYRNHYAVYHPSRPGYVYYYNPYKGRYWGRYDLQIGGYSTLAPQDRKAQLSQIPESAFPPPGPMPPAEPDGEEMLPPPEAGLGTAPGALRLPRCVGDRA